MVKEATSLKIDKEVLDRVRIRAKKENRPMSNFIETVLIKYLNEVEATENPGE